MKHEFHIAPAWCDLLEKHHLDDFELWMSGELGELVSKSGSSEVRRVVLDGEELYLKRRYDESAIRLLESVCFMRLPMSGAIRELAVVQALASAGFPVMEPIAWGEARVACIPKKGFLVVRGLPGRSLAEVYQGAEADERIGIMSRLGELLGRLHAAGFFQPLRLKDLIQGSSGEWTLIDRECARPWRKRFSQRSAVTSLARTARRTLRDGHTMGHCAVRAFLDGYLKGICGCWHTGRIELLRLIHAKLRHERKH